MASTSVASMASMCHFKVSGGMTWKSDLDAEMNVDIGNREPSFQPPGPGQAFASPDLRSRDIRRYQEISKDITWLPGPLDPATIRIHGL